MPETRAAVSITTSPLSPILQQFFDLLTFQEVVLDLKRRNKNKPFLILYILNALAMFSSHSVSLIKGSVTFFLIIMIIIISKLKFPLKTLKLI